MLEDRRSQALAISDGLKHVDEETMGVTSDCSRKSSS